MPSGEPPAPQPNEPDPLNEPTVKDQLMRTFSAVRTRLRGATTGEDGEDDADGGEHDEGSGHAAGYDEPSTNGGRGGNGDRHDDHSNGTREQAAPADPLLAAQPSNGTRHADETLADDDELVAVAPPEPEDAADEPAAFVAAPAAEPDLDTEPIAPLPAPIPVPVGADPDADPGGPPSNQAQPAARRKGRPALPILRRRPRVRKVTRIVRRVDAWGIFKISLIFYVILYIILLVAGVLLWNLANTTGTVANVEGFIRDLFGLKTFEFDGEKLFRASWVLGAVLVIAGTGLNVTLAILFNLISDLVGGVRVTVLEEEVVLRQRPVLPREMAPAVDAQDGVPLAEPLPGPATEPLAEPLAAPPTDAADEPYEAYEYEYEPVYEPADATHPTEALDASDPLLAETPRRARALSRRQGSPPGNGNGSDVDEDDVGATARPDAAPPEGG